MATDKIIKRLGIKRYTAVCDDICESDDGEFIDYSDLDRIVAEVRKAAKIEALEEAKKIAEVTKYGSALNLKTGILNCGCADHIQRIISELKG